MSFIEILNENFSKFANKPILADDTVPKGLTFSKVGEISGKVYQYLQNNNIGKEDFVMICLPRGVKPILALLGVWRNGSAFVLVEDNYAPERIEYIKTNCNCKLVIDANNWDEIQKCDVKEGFEKTDEHDAAFAVYTSGTTGNPKGVLHEYGNIDRMLSSVTLKNETLAEPNDRFALVAPLNFVASMLIIVVGLQLTVFNYVVPYKTIKNPLLVGMFIMMNKITGTFLTPSHIRRMGDKIRDLGLKFCIVGSEPANDIYVEGLKIHNFYLMSESAFAVCHFLIDKKYEKTPVGDSEFGHKILLLDEDGKEVTQGEEGEICFENKYSRGYINLPEETSKNFRDGLYHTGDLAYRDELGRVIICGRLSDMVKINGNRVEPGEIEGVAKKVLGIDWAAARIFDDGKKVFIALYYTDKKVKVDQEKVRKDMEKFLPYYMIPSFFIKIDSVPLRPNGKMDRKALPAPNFDDYKETYVEPTNDVERALCDAFAKVLNMDRIGINDDFYSLGGDSLGSMDVISAANLPNLTVNHIFRGHTAQKIAKIYMLEESLNDGVDPDEANKVALTKAHPLTPEQVYMMDYQMYTPLSTMYNLNSMLKFDIKVLDMEKLAKAVKIAAFNHPAILTTFFFNEDGEPMQKYSPELWEDIVVEKMSESELNHIKKNLVQPFKMVGKLMFRCRIFQTANNGYLFLDIHHTLFDGTSSKVFVGDILKAYYDQPLEPDYYYYTLQRRAKLTETSFYQESKEYFDKTYNLNGVKWQKFPTIDHESRENENNEIFAQIPIEKEEYEKFLKDNGLSPNAFFITANILATALFNKYKDIMVSWIYNGRNDAKEMQTVGLLFRNLPVAVSLRKDLSLKDLFADVVNQINKGIEHSCYPAIELNRSVVTDDIECVLYQDDLREIGDIPGLLGEVELESKNAASQNILDLEILNSPEGLQVMVDYASSRYDETSMKIYAQIMCSVCKSLVQYGVDDDIKVGTVLRNVYRLNHLGGLLSLLTAFNWLK